MSWWNDLSTARTVPAGGADGGPLRVSSFGSPHAAAPVASDLRHLGSVEAASGGCATDESTWGRSTTRSDSASLWRTSNSVGVSDQVSASEISAAAWGPSVPRSPPPPAMGTQSTLLGEPARLHSTGSGHGFVLKSDGALLAAAVPRSPRRAEPPRDTVASNSDSAAGENGGNGGDGDDDDDDDVSLYDDVDVGTISSLIASLQCRSGQPDNDEERLSLHDGALGDVQRAMPQRSGSRGLFVDPALPTRDGDLSGSRSAAGPALPSPQHLPAPVSTSAAQEATSLAPLHLTPSMLDGLLANFQTALRSRSGDGAVAAPAAAAAPFLVPQVADTELSQPDRFGSPYAHEDLQAVPSLHSHASPPMRSHVTSVVAHKLQLDSGARSTPAQDFRRGLAGSVSSGCSDPPTPVRHRGSSVPSRGVPSHHTSQHRAASPDSSIDHLFSQAMPLGNSFAAVLPVASAPVMEAGGGVTQPQHHHLRTISDVSLPAAAATYNGGTAVNQHVDERGCITVVDPQRRKLHVPFSSIVTTKALNGRLKTPSLCLLFQSGRCRQGDNCYQVHIDPATVDRLRAEAENQPCCCLLHGDCNSHLADPAAYEGRVISVAGQLSVPLARVAYTVGLQRLLQEDGATVTVAPSVLCRLHGQPGGCRFGADCKFLHVCCTILNNELAVVMSTASAAAAAAAATVGSGSNSAATSAPTHAVLHNRTNSGLPGSQPMYVHSHTSSAAGLLSSAANAPLSGGMSSPTVMTTRPVTLAGELRLSPSLSVQQSALPLQHTGSPMVQELWQASGVPAPGMYNRGISGHNLSSVGSSGNLSSMQFAQAVGAQPPLQQQQQQQQSSSGQFFTITSVQQPRNSPAQTPVLRPSMPMQPASMPESPHPHYHMRTLSTQSTGPYLPYANPPAGMTPNRSGAASPMCAGLPPGTPSMAGGFGTAQPPPSSSGPGLVVSAGRGNGFASPMQRQAPQQGTPPQQHHQPPHQHHHHHQHTTSQQLFVQQINQDGSMSFVPVGVVQNLSG